MLYFSSINPTLADDEPQSCRFYFYLHHKHRDTEACLSSSEVLKELFVYRSANFPAKPPEASQRASGRVDEVSNT